ncbi:MAG: class I SAM-dependent methyltransferase [Caldimonas sp.]
MSGGGDDPNAGGDVEIDAVRARYARRFGSDARYSPLRPAVLLAAQERQRATLALFARLGFADLAALRVVEVGSGGGGNLLELLGFGFAPSHLAGIELLAERHAAARERLPEQVQLDCGDASVAPVAPGSIDIVLASTVFSSLLDDAFQARLAAAMWRWVKPGGGVLWYDFTVDNPNNADVRGVPRARIRALFPEAAMQHRRLTLAPPIARAVCRVHPGLYGLFSALPALRTHALCWLGKPVGSDTSGAAIG